LEFFNERFFFPGDSTMLKAHVGLSRKFSRNYNSTGYSVNLEGEISAPSDQPDAILEQIDRLFELADQALQDEMGRDRGIPVVGQETETSLENSPASLAPPARESAPPPANGRPSASAHPESATARQIQYLQTLAKRQAWSLAHLEEWVAEILGRPRPLQELTKKEAGKVIQELVRIAPA
jgi:hypothetical protein